MEEIKNVNTVPEEQDLNEILKVRRAKLDGKIKVTRLAVKDFSSELKNGTIVTNPPYGERVYDKSDAERCYKDLGNSLKGFDGWSLFAITPHRGFERCFGRKCDREIKLYNAEKECRYYFYYSKKQTDKTID